MSRIRVHYDERTGELLEYRLGPPHDVVARGLRAFLLAPTLEVYRALLAGERVPMELLKPEAVARYGLRRSA